jgi:cytochrome c oxidase cbb3-type subunit III
MKPERKWILPLPILGLLATFAYTRTGTSVEPAAAPPAQPAIPTTIDYESHLNAGGTPPPAGVLTNPYKDDKAMAAAAGFAAPSLADQRWRYGGSDEEIFQSIYFGRPKGMPAFGGALGSDGIWILVTYLHSLPPPGGSTQSWEKH